MAYSALDDLGFGDDTPTQNSDQSSTNGSPAVWTLLGENGTNEDGLVAAASTIHNRAKKFNVNYDQIVTDPKQGYEAWNNEVYRNKIQHLYPVDSPAYTKAKT